MTLASSIITDAYRETNLIPMAGSPSTAQTTEALGRLNSLILSTIGNEAGNPLEDLNIGGDYDQSSLINVWVPEDTRLVLNLTAALTLYLPPQPRDGQRLAVMDVGSNLATYNLTLDGNGRNIEGAATLVLSTDDTERQWMYRADTGNWVRIAAIADSDELPFPAAHDEYFIMMLAMRLNPRYGQSLSPESAEALKRARKNLRARYNPSKQVYPDLDVRSFLTSASGVAFSGDDFARGRPWPWM